MSNKELIWPTMAEMPKTAPLMNVLFFCVSDHCARQMTHSRCEDCEVVSCRTRGDPLGEK